MKNITKGTSLFTSLILAIMFTVFVSLYISKNNDYKILEAQTQNVFGNQKTRIGAIDDRGTTILDKIYSSSSNERYLSDILINDSQNYKMVGSYVESIRDVYNDKGVDGIYSQGFGFSIESPTYYDVHNNFDYANLETSREKGVMTSVGAGELALIKSNLFVFTLNPR